VQTSQMLKWGSRGGWGPNPPGESPLGPLGGWGGGLLTPRQQKQVKNCAARGVGYFGVTLLPPPLASNARKDSPLHANDDDDDDNDDDDNQPR
jgi:hypothetical protein